MMTDVKEKELREFILRERIGLYRQLRRPPMGMLLRLPGKAGQAVIVGAYKLTQKIYGFN